MSVERAYVNCQRCYGLAEDIKSRAPADKSTAAKNILNDRELWIARNEAMKALGEFASAVRPRTGPDLDKGAWEVYQVFEFTTYSGEILELLEACRTCDYSKATIAELLDETWFGEKEETRETPEERNFGSHPDTYGSDFGEGDVPF